MSILSFNYIPVENGIFGGNLLADIFTSLI